MGVKMKKLLLFLLFVFSCQQSHPLLKEYSKQIKVVLSNKSIERTDELISIKLDALKGKYKDFNASAFVVFDGNFGKMLP